MLTLRPYQATELAEIRHAYASGRRAPLLCAPTGSGKSAVVQYMMERAKYPTLILCHRAELLDRISDDLGRIPHGRIVSGRRITPNHIQVGMVQTVARRLGELPAFRWVISDECHLAMSATWRSILDHYRDVKQLGMSATPCRLDGQPLGDVFDQIIYGPSVSQLVTMGYLAPCRVFAPAVDVAAIKKSRGDYNMDEAAKLLDRSSITGSAVAEYRRRRPGRPAIVFCCTRDHAEHVAEQFRREGVAAANVDGAMTPTTRAEIIRDFRAGRIHVLTNVELLTTGFDMPSIEVGIFLRPTQSTALYLQMVGRIMRIAPNKPDCILLDHVGNVLRHGMPDAQREWTLEGRVKSDRPPPVRQCPECFAAFAPAPRCPYCGFNFWTDAATGRTPPKAKAGDLVEVTTPGTDDWLATAPLKVVMKGVKTAAMVRKIAALRGYKPGWAAHQIAERSRYSWWEGEGKRDGRGA